MTEKSEQCKEELLRQTDLFSYLCDENIRIVAENSRFCHYQNGEAVFLPGDPGRALYIVESGEVIVRKSDAEGRSSDIARYVPGNSFGELDLFTSAPAGASAFAADTACLLEFPGGGKKFPAFLDENPSLSALILHRMLVETAGRIRRANDLVKENSPLVMELRKQVYRDKLTGLYNQVYITERLRELTGKGGVPFALCITKPDNFKVLNDTFGHEAGDSAIRIMARGLRDFIGDDERTARYKGNALAVILPGCARAEAEKEALNIRNFLQNLDVSAAAGGKPFVITASIGISLYPGFTGSVEEMLFKTHELPLVGRTRGGSMILFTEDMNRVEH